MELKKIETVGEVIVMYCDELWINTPTDERITVRVKDKKLRNELYCSAVKVTIEVITQEELKKHL